MLRWVCRLAFVGRADAAGPCDISSCAAAAYKTSLLGLIAEEDYTCKHDLPEYLISSDLARVNQRSDHLDRRGSSRHRHLGVRTDAPSIVRTILRHVQKTPHCPPEHRGRGTAPPRPSHRQPAFSRAPKGLLDREDRLDRLHHIAHEFYLVTIDGVQADFEQSHGPPGGSQRRRHQYRHHHQPQHIRQRHADENTGRCGHCHSTA